MEAKQAIYIADTLDNARKFQQALSNLGVETSAGSSMRFAQLLSSKETCDLVVFEVCNDMRSEIAPVEQMLIERGGIPLLVVVRESLLPNLSLPMQLHCDFVLETASVPECVARIRALLWPGGANTANDQVSVDSMTINLATYQVRVGGVPVDFTYLEYALLAFLVTHPGRTYSRDALLRRVWGFDYYGGSRTVDVHVRRVRAKLGPELAQHLETVRGVGYLWN